MGFRSQAAALSELVADSITGATITGAAIIGGTITGALISTAAAGARWVMGVAGNQNYLYSYSGDGTEIDPAWITNTNGAPGITRFTMQGAMLGATGHVPQLMMQSNNNAASQAFLTADAIDLLTDVVALTNTSRDLRGQDFGVAAVAIAAAASAGSVVVNHNLGVIPTSITLGMGSNTGSYCCSYGGATATQFTINAFHRAGTVGAANLSVSWDAKRG